MKRDVTLAWEWWQIVRSILDCRWQALEDVRKKAEKAHRHDVVEQMDEAMDFVLATRSRVATDIVYVTIEPPDDDTTLPAMLDDDDAPVTSLEIGTLAMTTDEREAVILGCTRCIKELEELLKKLPLMQRPTWMRDTTHTINAIDTQIRPAFGVQTELPLPTTQPEAKSDDDDAQPTGTA